MQSRVDVLSTILGDLSDPSNPHRNLSAAQIRRFAEAEQDLARGEALGDTILWLMRLPGALRAALRAAATHDLSSQPH